MNKNKLAMRCKKRNAVFVFATVALMALTLSACGDDGRPAETSGAPSAPARITKLVYKNDTQPFDYLKEALAKGDRSIDQCAYALHEAGSIPLSETGDFSFSGGGPGYVTQSSGDVATEMEEGPMHIEITGRIEMKAFSEAMAKDTGSAVIGQGKYTHTASATKKSTFAKGDYESTSYTETAECELQITYYADSNEIMLSAKDGYFDVNRSGKLTQSYDGDIEESAYEKVEQGYASFRFIPE